MLGESDWRRNALVHQRRTRSPLVRVVDDSSPPAALAENILSPCANCVEIVLVDGVLVRVPPGADRQTLADVLAVLRAGTPTSGQHAAAGEESPAC